MADLKGKIGQIATGAVVLNEAYPFWQRMVDDLKKDKALDLKVKQGYVSKFDIVDELRKRVKDKAPASDPTLASLLDPKASIADILGVKPSGSAATGSAVTGSATTGSVQATGSGFPSGSYDKLEKYITTLGADKYEPPLSIKEKSPTQTFEVQPLPNIPSQDPRRTGKVFVVDPEAVKNKDLLSWIYNNSLLYGFLPYGSPEPNAFYFVGKEKLKELVKTSNDVGKIVSSFLGSSLPKDIITISVDKVLTHSLTPAAEFADPGNLDEVVVPADQITNNKKQKITLFNVPGSEQAIRADAAFAYAAMKDAASKDGVNLSLGSGFRPAFGEFTSMTTKSGKKLPATSQYSLRKSRAPGKGEDHWLNAKSSAYSPAVAPPGKSNHGNGIALDLNTGGYPAYPDKPFLEGGKIMKWLTENAHRFGFLRTVSSEAWHWEYYPPSKPDGKGRSSETGPYTFVPSSHVTWGPYGSVDWKAKGGFAGTLTPGASKGDPGDEDLESDSST